MTHITDPETGISIRLAREWHQHAGPVSFTIDIDLPIPLRTDVRDWLANEVREGRAVIISRKESQR